MRLSEDHPLDPVVLAELEAIDATLRGEAVEPDHAELAELALFLAAERPQMPAEAAQSLDVAVARRFAPVVAGPRAGAGAHAGDDAQAGDDPHARAGADAARGRGGRSSTRRGLRVRSWARRPAFGLGLAGVAAVAVAGVLVLSPGAANTTNGTHAAAKYTAPTPAPQAASSSAAQTSSSAAQTRAPFAPSAQAATPNGAPAPASNGRKTIQSAQLQLIASGDRIDAVSQELFSVVGLEDGIVKSSTVTAASGDNSYASFQLSIPTANLASAMTQLSELRYAHVASRTDATQDVNGQYLSDVRALADAQALRTGLLKQLANATTQAQIDSLTGQIHDADTTIAANQATLSSLNSRISYSPLQVQINTGTAVVPAPSTGSTHGFTLGRAWHDAVRVLTVAAGVGLIALAALLPIALLVALVLWIFDVLRRRRREAALDAA
jgi:hypothetical protein